MKEDPQTVCTIFMFLLFKKMCISKNVDISYIFELLNISSSKEVRQW